MQLRCKFRQAKVQNLRLAALSDEDIGRLDVPMDDSLRVRRVQRVRDLNRPVKQRIRLQGLTLDTLLQRLAFQQLHRDGRLPSPSTMAWILPRFGWSSSEAVS